MQHYFPLLANCKTVAVLKLEFLSEKHIIWIVMLPVKKHPSMSSESYFADRLSCHGLVSNFCL